MKRLLFLFGLTAIAPAPKVEAKVVVNSIVTQDLIDKFAMIESNYNYDAVGDKGKALGAWQMHREAVEESFKSIYRRTGHDYTKCWGSWDKKTLCQPIVSKMLAKEYMCILEKQFITLGIEVTPIKLYMAWNLGFSGARHFGFDVNSVMLDGKRASILKRANYILSR
jgi:hypothetical protein